MTCSPARRARRFDLADGDEVITQRRGGRAGDDGQRRTRGGGNRHARGRGRQRAAGDNQLLSHREDVDVGEFVGGLEVIDRHVKFARDGAQRVAGLHGILLRVAPASAFRGSRGRGRHLGLSDRRSAWAPPWERPRAGAARFDSHRFMTSSAVQRRNQDVDADEECPTSRSHSSSHSPAASWQPHCRWSKTLSLTG